MKENAFVMITQKHNIIHLMVLLNIIIACISPYLGYIFLMFLLLVYFIYDKEGKTIIDLFTNKHLLAMIIYLIINSFFSYNKINSFFALVVIFSLILLFMIINSNFIEDSKLKLLIDVFIFSSIIVSSIGIAQIFLLEPANIPKSWIDNNTYNINIRVFSTLYNPNVLAGYLGIIISMTILSIESINTNTKYFVVLVISSICLIFTYSRGGLIALFCAIIYIFIVRKKFRYLMYIVILIILMYILGGVCSIQRMQPDLLVRDSAISYRLEVYKACINIFFDNPVIGTGIFTLRDIIHIYSNNIKGIVYHGHNLVIHILAEIGILGASLVFLIFSKYIKKIFTTNSKTILGIRMAIITVAVQGVVDGVIFTPQFAFFLCNTLAIGNMLVNKYKKDDIYD